MPGTGGESSVTVEVRVALKPGVMDAEAETIEKSLGLLGIVPAPRVRTARIYVLEFAGVDRAVAEAKAREAVDRLLANPVVHQATVRTISD